MTRLWQQRERIKELKVVLFMVLGERLFFSLIANNEILVTVFREVNPTVYV
jgi:hypothetical protein